MSNYVVSFLLVVWLFCLSFLSSPNRGTPSVLNPRLNPVSIGAVFENKAPVSKVIDTPSAKITKENILNLKKYSSLEIENNYGVDWSPDGKLIAQATSKGVYLFPATTLRQNTFIDFPYAYAVQFAHSSKLLAIGSYNQNSNEGALSVWDISTQQMIWQEKFQGGGITEISFSEDDSYIAFSGMITASGKTKYLATITSANEPKEIFTTYVNEQPIPISWEGEKLWFFSGGNQYSIRYYDIRSKNVYGFVQSKEFNASNDMSFYHPGQILAFDRVGDLHMWDMKKKKQVIVYYEDNSHGGYVQFSTLGKYIFHKGIVREVGSGAVVATLGESLQFIDWSPDETKMVISRGKEHETAVINFKNGYVYQQKIWSGPMGFADVSPTGNYLAMQIYGTREIEVFDLQDFSKPIKVIHCKFDNVGIFVKFSTDGSLMATCSEDKYGLTIWDTTVWEKRLEMPLNAGVSVPQFSEDQKSFFWIEMHSPTIFSSAKILDINSEKVTAIVLPNQKPSQMRFTDGVFVNGGKDLILIGKKQYGQEDFVYMYLYNLNAPKSIKTMYLGNVKQWNGKLYYSLERNEVLYKTNFQTLSIEAKSLGIAWRIDNDKDVYYGPPGIFLEKNGNAYEEHGLKKIGQIPGFSFNEVRLIGDSIISTISPYGFDFWKVP